MNADLPDPAGAPMAHGTGLMIVCLVVVALVLAVRMARTWGDYLDLRDDRRPALRLALDPYRCPLPTEGQVLNIIITARDAAGHTTVTCTTLSAQGPLAVVRP